MRTWYRERTIISGDYAEVEIYPVFPAARAGKRKAKAKPTSEVQAALNARNAQRRAVRLINANFTPEDIKCELTYRDGDLPESAEDAQRELINFFRRIKRWRRRAGLAPLKYLASVERGEKGGRIHHHVVMSGGMLPAELAAVWGRGYIRDIKPLQFDDKGVEGLAKYFTKEKTCYRHYIASRNLEKPVVKERTGAIAARDVRYMAANPDDKASARRYENAGEWRTVEIEGILNDYNGLPYVSIKLCRDTGHIGRHKGGRTPAGANKNKIKGAAR